MASKMFLIFGTRKSAPKEVKRHVFYASSCLLCMCRSFSAKIEKLSYLSLSASMISIVKPPIIPVRTVWPSCFSTSKYGKNCEVSRKRHIATVSMFGMGSAAIDQVRKPMCWTEVHETCNRNQLGTCSRPHKQSWIWVKTFRQRNEQDANEIQQMCTPELYMCFSQP